MVQVYLIWTLNLGLLGLIVFRSVGNGISRVYPVFYGYVSFVFAAALGQVLVALFFGIASPQYYYAFHLPSLLIPLLQLWVLWDLYRRSLGNAKIAWKEPLLCASLALMITAPVAWKIFSLKRGDPFLHYHALLLPLQVIACLFVYRKAYADRQIDPGRNLKGILLGLGVMVAVQSVNFARYLFVQPSFQIFEFFVPFVYLLSLIIFAYTLWDYAPLRRFDPLAEEQFAKVNEQLEQVLKLLLLR